MRQRVRRIYVNSLRLIFTYFVTRICTTSHLSNVLLLEIVVHLIFQIAVRLIFQMGRNLKYCVNVTDAKQSKVDLRPSIYPQASIHFRRVEAELVRF